MRAERLDQSGYRSLFPALETQAWFDTPGAPPGARPVVAAVERAMSDWLAGRVDWQQWDTVPQDVRSDIARAHAVPDSAVALMASVSEAMATVAAAHQDGTAVVLDDEYRSVRFPLLQRGDVMSVPVPAAGNRTTALLDAIRPGVRLVAFSEVLTVDGVRVDVRRVADAAHRVGARVFVDATQSFGVLDTSHVADGADYVAVHGYKWMLCPRGAAWLVAADGAAALRPLAPGWKSTALPHGYFGGDLNLAPGAARLDSSPAWVSWIGARAALAVHLRLDMQAVEAHVTGLRDTLAAHAQRLGYRVTGSALPTHIAVIESLLPTTIPESLRNHGVKATATPTRLRVGVHYFNDATDVDRLIRVLEEARP